ncbi:hypothetical protein JCM5296_002006 [Sporobolomyces johnsonii]
MVAASDLTLYSAKVCPWAQRATLALREVGAYDSGLNHVEIDLTNKPSWYASKVNPASKVPVLQIGKEGEKNTKFIPESGVLLELTSDLFPEKGLTPKDPVQRAEARYFAERYTQIVTGPLMGYIYAGKADGIDSLLPGLDEIQSLLAKHPGTFLLGSDISIGDLAVAPFVGRLFTFAKAGLLPEELAKTLTSDEKYAPLRAYNEALTSRPSWSATYDEEYILEKTKARIETLRAQAKQ